MKTQDRNQNNGQDSGVIFYPRIVREFEDSDEPMYYGGKKVELS